MSHMTVKERAQPKLPHGKLQRARKALKAAKLAASCVLVRERDMDRCRVCTATRGIEVHHVVYRSRGGGHETANLVCLCGECHRRVHAGKIKLSGDANERIEVVFEGGGQLTA